MTEKKAEKKSAKKKVTKEVSATKVTSAKKHTRRKASPRENSQGYLARAIANHVRITPRKMRLVLNMVKGKQVDQALHLLQFTPNKGAKILSKLLLSAIANAKERSSADVDRLWVSGGTVEQGPVLMRYMPAAHGRANPVRKRSSHITILLDQR